eukprot:4282913-Amphidinium_carterae.1
MEIHSGKTALLVEATRSTGEWVCNPSPLTKPMGSARAADGRSGNKNYEIQRSCVGGLPRCKFNSSTRTAGVFGCCAASGICCGNKRFFRPNLFGCGPKTFATPVELEPTIPGSIRLPS